MSVIVFDFEQWTVKDYQDFQQTIKNGDLEYQIQLMVKAIKRWDFEVEPTFENLLDMPYTIISELASTMGDTFKSMMDEPINGFSVDLSATKVSDFIKYQKALQTFDTGVIKDILSRVLRTVPQGFYGAKELAQMTDEQIHNINLEHFFGYLRAVSMEFSKNQSGK